MAEITVLAECVCNSQETACEQSPVTGMRSKFCKAGILSQSNKRHEFNFCVSCWCALSGQYECVCGGNTAGKYCEQCLPLFNQFAYTIGTPCQGALRNKFPITLVTLWTVPSWSVLRIFGRNSFFGFRMFLQRPRNWVQVRRPGGQLKHERRRDRSATRRRCLRRLHEQHCR